MGASARPTKEGVSGQTVGIGSLMPCLRSQRLTGQLVTKPSIIPICIRNQWLELSVSAFQLTYCAGASQPDQPTSKLRTESLGDSIASASGATRAGLTRHGTVP